MKYILFTLTLIICYLSFSQNGILYIDKNSTLFKSEMDAFLNENSPQSLINFLKKELRRSEISGETEAVFVFNFNQFSDGYYDQFGDEIELEKEGVGKIKGILQVAGLASKFLSDVVGDTNILKIKPHHYIIDNEGIKNYNSYYCLDDIEGVVFLEEDFSQEIEVGEEVISDRKYDEIFEERGFYRKTRIGFVRTFRFKNELNPNEVLEKKCITFSIPISTVEKMGWGYKFEKMYMDLKKKSLKQQKKDISGKELFFMDYSNVKEIAKTFYYSTSKYKDLHFGIKIFQY
jgi:hypothetical protein